MPSRGDPPVADLTEINSEIPEAVSLQTRALAELNPVNLAILFGPRSNRDKAAAYLQDVAAFLTEARYALFEARAHWIWHTKHSPREQNTAALFFAQYYLDDAILRMFSTGEHLAGFVECYLSIGRSETKDAGKNKRRGMSRLARLGGYCGVARQAHPILSRVVALVDNAGWGFVSDYRNKWVHDQRPRLQGLGDTYARQSRWKKTKHRASELAFSEGDRPEVGHDITTFMLGIGQGDPPDLTIEKFFEQTIAAYALLRDLVGQCCDDLEAEVAMRRTRTPPLSSKEY